MSDKKADINAIRFNLATQVLYALRHEFNGLNLSKDFTIDKAHVKTVFDAYYKKLEALNKTYKQRHLSYKDEPIPEEFQLPKELRYGF